MIGFQNVLYNTRNTLLRSRLHDALLHITYDALFVYFSYKQIETWFFFLKTWTMSVSAKTHQQTTININWF